MVAKARQAEFQAEVEHYRSGQQHAALVPTVSDLVAAAARVPGRVWGECLARARVADRRGSERRAGKSWPQVDGTQRGRWEPLRSLFAQRRPTTALR